MIPKQNIYIAENISDFYEEIFPSNKLNENLFKQGERDKKSLTLDEEINPSKILWFRGQMDSSWSLQPAIYRKIKKIIESPGRVGSNKFDEVLRDRERRIFDDFKTKAHHLLQNPPDNYYLWMSLMQHYGVATRLLDWCEEVNTALFFAMEKYFEFGYQGDTQFPCVWILNPYRLWYNANCFFNKQPWDGLHLKKESVIPSLLEFPQPNSKNKRPIYNSLPIPVIAPYTHERIKVQTGTFILFPEYFPNNNKYNLNKSDDLSLENLPYAQDCLIQIVFTKPWQISEELITIGLKRSLFYPELPNVSAETQMKFLRERKRK